MTTYRIPYTTGSGDLDARLGGKVDTTDRRLMPVFNVTAFGAKCDGVTDDTQAVLDAVAAAKAAGKATFLGAQVVIPDGDLLISAPIVLPRTGVSPTNVVQLVGSGIRTARITGSASFPANRGLIEWEQTATRAWHQRIQGLTFKLPDVAGVKAIHYKPTSKADLTAILAERLHITLEDLLVEGSNQYHAALIRLEGNAVHSTFRNLYGDPSRGTWAQDCILLHVDETELGLGAGFAKGGDDSGINYSTLENVHAGIRRGGFCAVFKGRMNQSALRTSFCNGMVDQAGYEFTNSFGCLVDNISNEGFGEKGQIRLTNCRGMLFTRFGLGAPDDPGLGHGVGDGLVLANVIDSEFRFRPTQVGQKAFSAEGRKAITIDAGCARLRFMGVQLAASLANEVSNAAPANADIYGEFFNVNGSTWETLGTRQHGAMAVTGDLSVSGKIVNNRAVVSKTTAATLTSADQYVRANATGGAFTLTLPTAVGNTGLAFTIKKVDASANAVTIATTASQTIDGTATRALAAQYDTVRVVSNGAHWDLI